MGMTETEIRARFAGREIDGGRGGGKLPLEDARALLDLCGRENMAVLRMNAMIHEAGRFIVQRDGELDLGSLALLPGAWRTFLERSLSKAGQFVDTVADRPNIVFEYELFSEEEWTEEQG